MALLICAALLAGLLTLFYYWSKKKYSYWSNKGVPGPTPYPVVGNFGAVMINKDNIMQYLKKLHLEYKEEKLVGLYRGFQPVILVRDPELIKHVLIKDFSAFQNRGLTPSSNRLSDNLFLAEGETWKILRQKLTPLFTSRKIKDMIPLMQKCINNFINYVDGLVENNIDHETRSLTSKFTLGIIGSCVFGLDLNTMTDDENEFSIMAKKVFQFSRFARSIMILDMIIPGLRNWFAICQDREEFFVNLVRNVIQERGGKPSSRKDFMDLMMELREQGKASRRLEDGISEIEIDDYMIAAQAFVFYSAGFESSAATMSFLIYEMALHPEIQERVYAEVRRTYDKYNGELNADAVKDMPYLEKVFDETSRKYTVAGSIFRKCTENYTFPGTNVTIPKGMPVFISITGLNVDPEYFYNPNEFNPDNFSSENLKNVPQCVYMSFGEGPRICIGIRFAKVQSMLSMAAFFKKFRVEPSMKTKRELEFDPKGVPFLVAKGGVWVTIKRR